MKVLIAVSPGCRGNFRVHDMLWPPNRFYVSLPRKRPLPDCSKRCQPEQTRDRETSNKLGCQQWVHRPVDTRFVCLAGGFGRLELVFTYLRFLKVTEC